MMAPRTPWRSISARPAAAVPPGEVTIRLSALAGLAEMERQGVRGAIIDGVVAAMRRAGELG